MSRLFDYYQLPETEEEIEERQRREDEAFEEAHLQHLLEEEMTLAQEIALGNRLGEALWDYSDSVSDLKSKKL